MGNKIIVEHLIVKSAWVFIPSFYFYKENNMKKLNLLLIASVVAGAALLSSSCGSDKTKIGILQPVEHDALSAARTGFISALAEKGYDETKVEFVYHNAGGKDAELTTMAKDLVSSCSMTLGIGTGAAQVLKSTSVDKGLVKPVLFTAVTDPVDAGLVDSLENGKGFVTGTSDAQPIEAQIDLIKECIPEADKIGILYTQSETNSVIQANQAKSVIESAGMSAIIKTATGPSDVSNTALALASESGLDAIYIPTDNNIAANTDAVKTAVSSKHILVVCGEESMTKGCGGVTLSLNYEELGKVTGRMAVEILSGEKNAKDIPVRVMTKEDCNYAMSSANLADAGVTLPESVTTKCSELDK